MESKKIYESTLDELNKIKRSLVSSTNIFIDLKKFDEITRGEIIASIRQVIVNRERQILNVLSKDV